jgi:hypothetical protein
MYTIAKRFAFSALPVYLQVGNPAPLRHGGRPLPDETEIDDLLTRSVGLRRPCCRNFMC